MISPQNKGNIRLYCIQRQRADTVSIYVYNSTVKRQDNKIFPIIVLPTVQYWYVLGL